MLARKRNHGRRDYELAHQKDLAELRYNLAHLSVDAVPRFYERAHEDCRIIYGGLPLPRQMQRWCSCGSSCGRGGSSERQGSAEG
jgi:hypothetical protein